MAQWEAYSWMAVAAASPLAVSVVVWGLAITKAFLSTASRSLVSSSHQHVSIAHQQFLASRLRWNGFDVLLALSLAAQASTAVVVGSWAVVRLLTSTSHVSLATVTLFIGVGASLRTLKLATLASLAVDGVIKIRRSIRRKNNDGGELIDDYGSPFSSPASAASFDGGTRKTSSTVVYHVFVLLIVSILVGLAACLALPAAMNDDDERSSSSSSYFYNALLPFIATRGPMMGGNQTEAASDGTEIVQKYDVKHSILLLAVEAPLILVVFGCLVYIQVLPHLISFFFF